jgi:phosphoadenosine phosphosulfate reductase
MEKTERMALPSEWEKLEARNADEVIDAILVEHAGKDVCFTCSFQAEDVIVLDLLRKRIPDIPVLFLETGYHFRETYEFRDRLTEEWGLHLVNVLPKQTVPEQESAFGILYRLDPTQCCKLRKVDPLLGALEPFRTWFTGLRREQSVTRKNLKKVELHHLPTGKALTKVSPLADWTWGQVWEYTVGHKLDCLPQYHQGYLSIGCEPCTALPEDPTNPRSGRWGGRKLECGIHTFSERSQ